MSALLSSGRFTSSPDELAAAYAHAAGGGGGGGDTKSSLTLEHLAAFATFGGGSGGNDWDSWVGAGQSGDGGAAVRRALVKARVKCRDAGLLGRSFPGEAFARLDPEGAGRLGRPAFKRGLREMGFALVDEVPEQNREEILGGDAQRRASEREWEVAGCAWGKEGREGGGGLGNIIEEVHCGEEEIRLRRVEGEEQDEARRNAFRKKVEDIERSTAEKARFVCPLGIVDGTSKHVFPCIAVCKHRQDGFVPDFTATLSVHVYA